MTVENQEPDLPAGYTTEFGPDSKSFLCSVKVLEKNTQTAFLGKQMVWVDPKIDPSSPKKVGNHNWVTGETAADYISQMKRAVDVHKSKGNKMLEPLSFVKCEANSVGTHPETQDASQCNYLFDSNDPNMAPQFEFLFMYSPAGTLHQWIRVTTNIFQRPALFMVNAPLQGYVIVNFRPDSQQNHIVVTPPLPTDRFAPSVKTYVEQKLVGKIFGVIDNSVPANDLAGFSQKWEKQQFDKATLVVLQAGAELGLVFATGGAAAVGLAWRQAMLAAGKAVAQRAFSKAAAIGIAKALLQTAVLTGQFYWILRLDRLSNTQTEGPLKDILWFGNLIAYGSMYYNIAELGNRFAAGLLGAVANGGMVAINRGFRAAVQNVRKAQKAKPLPDNFSLDDFFHAFPEMKKHYNRIMGQFQSQARASVAGVNTGALNENTGGQLVTAIEGHTKKAIAELVGLLGATASGVGHYNGALATKAPPKFEDRMCDNTVMP